MDAIIRDGIVPLYDPIPFGTLIKTSRIEPDGLYIAPVLVGQPYDHIKGKICTGASSV